MPRTTKITGRETVICVEIDQKADLLFHINGCNILNRKKFFTNFISIDAYGGNLQLGYSQFSYGPLISK
jgi:hypothetical protein